MRRALALACAACVPLGCALLSSGEPEVPVQTPARLFVRTLVGRPEPPVAREPRIAVVLDATGPMAAVTDAGPTHLTAARLAAERFLDSLDADVRVELWAVAGRRDATCASPPRSLDPEDRAALRRLGARGDGSIPQALATLLEPPQAERVDRVVVFTRLAGTCGDDLCAAARALAVAGVRLDLVAIGEERSPACLTAIAWEEASVEPAVWERPASIPYRVESTGPEGAVQACSETGGLPVLVQPGPAAIELALEPPLRIERAFAPGSRWLLEVLDFPGLDPPERSWRWRELPVQPMAWVQEDAP